MAELFQTHSPDRRAETQNCSLHPVCDEWADVLPQTSVSVQSPENVQSVDLQRTTTTFNWQHSIRTPDLIRTKGCSECGPAENHNRSSPWSDPHVASVCVSSDGLSERFWNGSGWNGWVTLLDELCGRTCGTVQLVLVPSAAGRAKAVSSFMVLFNRLQLEDLGSDDSKAYRIGRKSVLFHR